MSERSPAVHALLNYSQGDMDGIIVTTSRQAIHEVVDELAALRTRAEEAEARADDATSLYNTTIQLLHNERKRIAELEAELAAPRPYIVERAEAEVAKIVSSIREQESGK